MKIFVNNMWYKTNGLDLDRVQRAIRNSKREGFNEKFVNPRMFRKTTKSIKP